MLPRCRLQAVALCLLLGGCGTRGQVTFVLHDATDPRMRPDPMLVSEYQIRTTDGMVVGIAPSTAASPALLPLGALMPTMAPQDLVLGELSGTTLLGMARLRDVSIRAGTQVTYDFEVRKPLVFVGFGAPTEAGGMSVPNATEILDPTTPVATDLAHPPGGTPVAIADNLSTGAVTSDGRFYVGAQGNALWVFDTGRASSVGTAPLPFAPARVATAPRDTAVAAASAAGAIALYTDEAGLVGNPAAAQPSAMANSGAGVRGLAFSPDGQKLYALTGAADLLDPCDPGAPPSNAIRVFGLDGTMQASWQLPGFGSAIAVDPQSGAVLVSLAKSVSAIAPDAASGPVQPKTLFQANCPSAIQISNGKVVTPTSALRISSMGSQVGLAGTFDLIQGSTGGDAPATLAIPLSVFEQPIDMSGTNFDQVIRLLPSSVSGYELQVTPDGARAVIGVRTHFLLNNSLVLNTSCSTTRWC
jgi:hypothetical protein